MATKYEGKLETTHRCPEADLTFATKHYEILATKLVELVSGEATVVDANDEIFISVSKNLPVWVRISKEGVIEIGEPAR